MPEDLKGQSMLQRRLSMQVYALIAIACMKLGKAVQLHSSRSEVRVLLSWSRRFLR